MRQILALSLQLLWASDLCLTVFEIEVPALTERTDMKKPIYKVLYFQANLAIFICVLLGYFYPAIGSSMYPLVEDQLNLTKMILTTVYIRPDCP